MGGGEGVGEGEEGCVGRKEGPRKGRHVHTQRPLAEPSERATKNPSQSTQPSRINSSNSSFHRRPISFPWAARELLCASEEGGSGHDGKEVSRETRHPDRPVAIFCNCSLISWHCRPSAHLVGK